MSKEVVFDIETIGDIRDFDLVCKTLKENNSESKPQPKITPTLLPPSLQRAFRGGMSIELFNTVFDDNQPTLKYIMSYYFKNYREQIDTKIIPKILTV